MADAKEQFATRRRIFLCRYSVDKSPGLQVTLEIVMGSMAFAHILVSLVLLFVDIRHSQPYTNSESRATAILPLSAICFEVSLLSLLIALSVIKDMCCVPKDSLSVWQREALGRLMRNLVIGSLMGFSCLCWYSYVQPGSEASVAETVTPAMIAAGIGAAKVVLIRTERTWFWLGLSVLCVVQLTLLVLKFDLSLNMPWVWTLVPVYILSLDALFLSVTLASESFSTSLTPKPCIVLICVMQVSACGLLFLTSVLAALRADGLELIEVKTLMLLSLLTFALCYFSLCRQCGNYVLDIVWGHVETDFLHLKYPVLLTRQQSA